MLWSFLANFNSKVLNFQNSKRKKLEVIVIIGYAFGIARKFIQVLYLGYPLGEGFGAFTFYLGFFFYILNCVEILIDIALYFRNMRLDREREAGNNV